jgi:hypothetical protein
MNSFSSFFFFLRKIYSLGYRKKFGANPTKGNFGKLAESRHISRKIEEIAICRP